MKLLIIFKVKLTNMKTYREKLLNLSLIAIVTIVASATIGTIYYNKIFTNPQTLCEHRKAKEALAEYDEFKAVHSIFFYISGAAYMFCIIFREE